MVVLLAETQPLTIYNVIDQLNQQFPDEEFHDSELEDDEDKQSAMQSFVIGGFEGPSGEPSFFVKCLAKHHAGMFLIHNSSQRYFAGPQGFRLENEADQDELEVILKDHKAWLSIDMLDDFSSEEEGLRFMRVMAARFAPANALAVYDTQTRDLSPLDSELRTALSKGYGPAG